MEKFRITVASLPDREQLVAEILYEGVQWAEISQETDDFIIQFYSHARKKYWEFSLERQCNIASVNLTSVKKLKKITSSQC